MHHRRPAFKKVRLTEQMSGLRAGLSVSRQKGKSSHGGHGDTEGKTLTRRSLSSQRSDKVSRVFEDSKNGMDLEIDRSGQLSYFLRDPLSDLRDLCVNLWSFSSVTSCQLFPFYTTQRAEASRAVHSARASFRRPAPTRNGWPRRALSA